MLRLRLLSGGAWFLLCLFCGGVWARIVDDSHVQIDTGCPAAFQTKCQCGLVPWGPNSRLTYVTNCTNTGFEDSTMLKHLPVETEVLVFVGNDVYDLHFNIFGQAANYSNLHTVDLSNNHIQTIKGRTFHNVHSVKTLILDDNDLYLTGKDHHPRMFSNFENLEELSLRNAFSDKDLRDKASRYVANLVATFNESKLTKLKILDLSENKISILENHRTFCQLPSLEKLFISKNHLFDFDQDLTCLSHLTTLDLSHNYFPCFSNTTVNRLNKPGLALNLSGNPLRCDCSMRDTYQWIKKQDESRFPDKNLLRCRDGFPSNIGQKLTDLQLGDLVCTVEVNHYMGHLQVSYVVLSLILLIFAIVIGVVLFRNRAEVKALASRLSQPLRNKLNYSSLDRRDNETEMEV